MLLLLFTPRSGAVAATEGAGFWTPTRWYRVTRRFPLPDPEPEPDVDDDWLLMLE